MVSLPESRSPGLAGFIKIKFAKIHKIKNALSALLQVQCCLRLGFRTCTMCCIRHEPSGPVGLHYFDRYCALFVCTIFWPPLEDTPLDTCAPAIAATSLVWSAVGSVRQGMPCQARFGEECAASCMPCFLHQDGKKIAWPKALNKSERLPVRSARGRKSARCWRHSQRRAGDVTVRQFERNR